MLERNLNQDAQNNNSIKLLDLIKKFNADFFNNESNANNDVDIRSFIFKNTLDAINKEDGHSAYLLLLNLAQFAKSQGLNPKVKENLDNIFECAIYNIIEEIMKANDKNVEIHGLTALAYFYKLNPNADFTNTVKQICQEQQVGRKTLEFFVEQQKEHLEVKKVSLTNNLNSSPANSVSSQARPTDQSEARIQVNLDMNVTYFFKKSEDENFTPLPITTENPTNRKGNVKLENGQLTITRLQRGRERVDVEIGKTTVVFETQENGLIMPSIRGIVLSQNPQAFIKEMKSDDLQGQNIFVKINGVQYNINRDGITTTDQNVTTENFKEIIKEYNNTAGKMSPIPNVSINTR